MRIGTDNRRGSSTSALWCGLTLLGLIGGACSHARGVSVEPPTARLAVGDGLACMIDHGGHLRCWGLIDEIQAARAALVDASLPIVSVVIDGMERCVLDGTARWRCWPRERMTDRHRPASPGRGFFVSDDDECRIIDTGHVVCQWVSQSPRRIKRVRAALDVDSGSRYRCARRRGGQVDCWRRGDSSARRIHGLDAARAISVGDDLCALDRDDEVTCLQDMRNPVRVRNVAPASAIDVDAAFGCAVRSDRSVACWGNTGVTRRLAALLPNGDASVAHEAQSIPGLVDVEEVRVQRSYACTLGSDGSVRCWGQNDGFVLGDPTSAEYLAVPETVSGLPPMMSVQVLGDHTCATDGEGQRWCWLLGSEGPTKRGDSALLVADSPDSRCAVYPGDRLECDIRSAARSDQVVLTGLTSVEAMDAGGALTCVVAHGEVACFGKPSGSLVSAYWRSSAGWRATPEHMRVAVPGRALSVSVSETHACTVVETGDVYCWGNNDSGQVGASTGPDLAEPVPFESPLRVLGLPPVVSVAVGAWHTCALDRDRGVWCWGTGLATGQPSKRAPAPRQIESAALVALVSGDHHVCGLTTAHDVVCWGVNDRGQLGRGSVSQGDATMRPVQGLAEVTALSADRNTTCAVGRTGSVGCWGSNLVGVANAKYLPFAPEPIVVRPERMMLVR